MMEECGNRSDSLAPEVVGLSPFRIRHCVDLLLSIPDSIGDIAFPRKEGLPHLCIVIGNTTCIHEEMGEVFPGIYSHALAALDEAEVEDRAEVKVGIILKLHEENITLDIISRSAGLSIEEVERILAVG